MACKLCSERGKTWSGSDPKCAFETPVFNTENWNCATMNAIRRLVEDKSVYNEDTYCAVLPVFDCGEFLIVCHYKRRGRTEGAFIVDEGSVLPLTYDEAVIILRQYANGTMEHGHYRPTTAKSSAALQPAAH